MKQSLQLKIGQHLTMTPQLQQAIRLLQLSTLDLQQEIQEALDSNPMLDNGDEDQPQPSEPSELSVDDKERSLQAETTTAAASSDDSASTSDAPEAQLEDHWNSNDIPVELSTDSNWEDTFGNNAATGNRDEEYSFESTDSPQETLQDHLFWQLNLTPMSELDQLIAEAIIDGIDTEGYLRTSPEELLEHFQHSYPEQFEELELDEVEVVLRRIQQFDPPGVGARDLSECLAIQLRQLPSDTEHRQVALTIVENYIQQLGSHDYRSILRKARLKEPQLQAALLLVQSLNPRPGASIAQEKPEYVIPDVFVEKHNGMWQVRLNQDASPKLKVNNSYAQLVKRSDGSADNTYLKGQLQEARWLIKSLQSRHDTLLKVTRQIVAQQIDFFEQGEEAMKPMVLNDIADAVEMHESTISRATTQKYMHTPRGIYELKYFFSSHVGTSDGGAASSTAIRALIKKLLAEENPAKPLSDNKIAKLLEQEGINVARRTIAKYREAMGIAPSNERKRLV